MNTIRKFCIGVGAVMAVAVAVPHDADAAISFAGASGQLAAAVTFDVVAGTNLQVVLTNTSLSDVLVPADILTGVFFSGVPIVTPVSGILTAGSSVFYDPDGQPAGGNVGGEWAYATGLVGAPGGATSGISSAGFNLFGQANFNGPDLSNPTAVNGMNYGILSAGDNTATENGGIINSGGQIKNSVTFTLSGLPQGFNLGSISNVSFQYGTSLTEPNIPGGGLCPNGAPNFPICSPQVETPEPMSMAMLGIGLAGLGVARMRRRLA
jgi:hypothetical protein